MTKTREIREVFTVGDYTIMRTTIGDGWVVMCKTKWGRTFDTPNEAEQYAISLATADRLLGRGGVTDSAEISER